jgi:hypothetical protein
MSRSRWFKDYVTDSRVGGMHYVEPRNFIDMNIEGTTHDQPHVHIVIVRIADTDGRRTTYSNIQHKGAPFSARYADHHG